MALVMRKRYVCKKKGGEFASFVIIAVVEGKKRASSY